VGDLHLEPKSTAICLTLPIATSLEELSAGDQLLLSGVLYTARDAAHQRMMQDIQNGTPLPFDPQNATIYYVGPTPARPGQIIGSAGPTSSYRMDAYAPTLLDLGVKIMIGKGARSPEVIQSIIKNKAVYLGAIGGAAALIAKSIRAADVIAYPDLGTEAVRRLEVVDFPATVIIDTRGQNLYQIGPQQYLSSL